MGLDRKTANQPHSEGQAKAHDHETSLESGETYATTRFSDLAVSSSGVQVTGSSEPSSVTGRRPFVSLCYSCHTAPIHKLVANQNMPSCYPPI